LFVPSEGVTVSVTGWSTIGDVGAADSEMLFEVAALIVAVAVFEPAAAVTVAVRFVVNCTRASPVLSVFATLAESVPAVVLNVTGIPTRRLPFVSSTVAINATVPPLGGTVDGDAVSARLFAAAAPIVMSSWLLDPVVGVVPPVVVLLPPAAPDVARIVAVPDTSPALKVAVTTPFLVCASTGVTLPSVVVKCTVVPFCTGVPADSSTVAVISVVPPVGSDRVGALSETVEFVGANNGTLSQPVATTVNRRNTH
jgi:hypothetical protein